MKAIVYTRYGPPEVLQLREVDKPAPKDNEVLIRVHATTVTAADYRARGSDFMSPLFWLPARMAFGLVRPRRTILGYEFAGQIEAVGKDVSLFEVGDRVFGTGGSGAYAEYICLPETGVLTSMPANISYEHAAAVPFGGLTAVSFVRDQGKVRRGQKVLIYGASGGVGTAAVQVAKYYGAEVTGVCSTANTELVKSLEADQVIDYTREDFTDRGEAYDLIFNTVGKTNYWRCRRALKPGGIYLAAAFGLKDMLAMLWTAVIGSKKAVFPVAPERKEDLVFLKELIEAGKYKPPIDRRYPLEQAAEAHRYADQGHKKGNVVLTVAADERP